MNHCDCEEVEEYSRTKELYFFLPKIVFEDLIQKFSSYGRILTSKEISYLETEFLSGSSGKTENSEGLDIEDWVMQISTQIQSVAGQYWRHKTDLNPSSRVSTKSLDIEENSMWLIEGFISSDETICQLKQSHVPVGSFIIRFSMKKDPKIVLSVKTSLFQVTHRCLLRVDGRLKLEGNSPVYANDLRSLILEFPSCKYLYCEGNWISKSDLFPTLASYEAGLNIS